MRVGGSFANAADSGALGASGQVGGGNGYAIINRKIVEHLRATDAELRSKIRKEAMKNSGAPHFIDTRGPDLGLYTIDGMVLRGAKSVMPATQISEVAIPQQDDSNKADEQPVEPVAVLGATKTPGDLAASETAERPQAVRPAAYAGGGASGSPALIGVKRDLKA